MTEALAQRLRDLEAERAALEKRLARAQRDLELKVAEPDPEAGVAIVAAGRDVEAIAGLIRVTESQYRQAVQASRPSVAQAFSGGPLSRLPSTLPADIVADLRRHGPSRARELRARIPAATDVSAGIWAGYLAVLARDGVLERTGLPTGPLYAAPVSTTNDHRRGVLA